jgi:outer membrane protein assembly factor BamA
MRRCARVGALILALTGVSEIAIAQTLSVRPVLGGFPADSGFSLGAEVSRTRMLGPIDGHLKAVGSVKKYALLEAGFEVPNLGYWLYLGVTTRYRNYPEEDFWGVGPDTPKSARANYLFEDFDTTAVLGTRIGRFRTGITGGFVRINTGPGREEDLPSVPESLQTQPRYGHAGLYFEYKSLDNEGDPFSGGRYGFQLDSFGTKFQRFAIDLRRFVPITKTGRMAFRIQTLFTNQSSREEIPFYMLPSAGGTDTVRGFNQYRFRDRNALVLNAEYRRPVKFLDVVGFVDAGRVFSNPANLGLKDLHASGGVGARLKFGGRVFLGIDLAASTEGRRLWFRSGHTF